MQYSDSIDCLIKAITIVLDHDTAYLKRCEQNTFRLYYN